MTTDINEMNKYKQIYGFLKYYKDYILLIKTERFRDNKTNAYKLMKFKNKIFSVVMSRLQMFGPLRKLLLASFYYFKIFFPLYDIYFHKHLILIANRAVKTNLNSSLRSLPRFCFAGS